MILYKDFPLRFRESNRRTVSCNVNSQQDQTSPIVPICDFKCSLVTLHNDLWQQTVSIDFQNLLLNPHASVGIFENFR